FLPLGDFGVRAPRPPDGRGKVRPRTQDGVGNQTVAPIPKTLKFVVVIVAVLPPVSPRRGPWQEKSGPGEGYGRQGNTMGQGDRGTRSGCLALVTCGRASESALSLAVRCPRMEGSCRIERGRESRWK
uniref:TNF receptor superfamily member 10c n=1 Tax=Mandrillus leucophaeus TaxID=9568 RepID=A0A2K5YCS3_MANLE